MKSTLKKKIAMLLCLCLCLSLFPAAYAEGDGLFPVLFYTEKGYDLLGLVVTDGAGKVLEHAETDGGWTYLLAPGTYTYRYRDDRGIFTEIGETAFTVDGTLEIALDLKAAFEDRFVFSWELNPLYEGVADNLPLDDFTYEDALDEMIMYKIAESESGGQRPRLRVTPSVQLRRAMTERQEKTPIRFYSDTKWSEADVTAQYQQVVNEALWHTGDHREGDTLSLEYYKYGKSAERNNYDEETGKYYHDIIFVFVYRTTSAQEQAVINTVESMASGLSGMSEYQKAFAINQWLYQNVNYDYVHAGDDHYQAKFTAYAALMNKLAVCQGFTISFYRVALAAGLDARIITSSAMGHAWNIVKIDGVWYELDPTWDSNRREGGTPLSQLPHYFLHGSTWWETEHRNSGGSTIGDQFFFKPEDYLKYDPLFSTYMLSPSDYVPEEPGTYIVSYNANRGDSAPGSQVKIHGTDLTLTEELPTRAPLPEETLTLTLDGNGGTLATTDNPKAPKVSIQGKKNVNFSFIEWNTERDRSGTVYNPGAVYQTDASVELFAQWKATAGYSMFTLPTPSREGYFFLGWGASSDAAEGVTGNYELREDTTLYAVWVQPDLILPASLTEIEEEAFASCDFTFVKLSENTLTVGPRAFADCPNLKYIYIPAETTVDPIAFENVEGLTIFRPAA